MSNKELAAQVAALTAELATLKAATAPKPAAARTRGPVYGLGLVFGTPAPRMVYQDQLFQQNTAGWVSVGPDGERKTVHLTDAELLVLNLVEHPTCSGRMDLRMVRIMRNLFNQGKHSPAQPVPPSVPSCGWSVDGTPVGEFAEWYRRTVAA
jgi:hypothetical protein